MYMFVYVFFLLTKQLKLFTSSIIFDLYFSLLLPASHITVIKVIVACNNKLLLFIASSCNYRNTSAMALMSSISIILQKRH